MDGCFMIWKLYDRVELSSFKQLLNEMNLDITFTAEESVGRIYF